MKIQNHPQIIQAMRSYDKNKTQSSEKSGQAASAKDKIELSETAMDFQRALKAFRQLPEIRQDRVQAVKEKMAKGEEATAEEIADKMIADLNLRSTL